MFILFYRKWGYLNFFYDYGYDYALSVDAEYEDMISWLQVHHQPQAKLLDLWKRTAKGRLAFIHGQASPSLDTIWQQWPRYKDKDGFILVTGFVAIHVLHIYFQEF